MSLPDTGGVGQGGVVPVCYAGLVVGVVLFEGGIILSLPMRQVERVFGFARRRGGRREGAQDGSWVRCLDAVVRSLSQMITAPATPGGSQFSEPQAVVLLGHWIPAFAGILVLWMVGVTIPKDLSSNVRGGQHLACSRTTPAGGGV